MNSKPRLTLRPRSWVLALSLAVNAGFLGWLLLRPGVHQLPLRAGGHFSPPLKSFSPKPRPAPAALSDTVTFSSLPLCPLPVLDDNPAPSDRPTVEPTAETLPCEKERQLQSIASDYAELTRDIYAHSSALIAPEDREKLTFLEREKNADLTNALTPRELEEYQFRSTDRAWLRRR